MRLSMGYCGFEVGIHEYSCHCFCVKKHLTPLYKASSIIHDKLNKSDTKHIATFDNQLKFKEMMDLIQINKQRKDNGFRIEDAGYKIEQISLIIVARCIWTSIQTPSGNFRLTFCHLFRISQSASFIIE